jgi:hypothetical protein
MEDYVMKLGVLVRSGVVCALAAFGLSAQADVANNLRDSVPEVRPVQSNEELRPHVAVLAGVANPEGSFSTGAEYGIDVGFQPYIPFGFGLEVSQAGYNAQAGNPNDFKRTNFLLKTSYNLGGDTVVLKDSYIGLAAGMLVEDTGPTTNTYGGLMPNIGFDIKTFEVNDRWVSLGANARYLLTASDNPDVFGINGVVKYWF